MADFSTVICWTSPFVIWGGGRIYYVAFILFLMENPVSKTVDPDQTQHYVASDLGLHSLLTTFYGFPGKDGLNKLKKKNSLF